MVLKELFARRRFEPVDVFADVMYFRLMGSVNMTDETAWVLLWTDRRSRPPRCILMISAFGIYLLVALAFLTVVASHESISMFSLAYRALNNANGPRKYWFRP
ncbi:hypothetical protein BCR43DRAFT_506186 [Syncephalastrum racemosum]|uniref:Uncharacterized protein n=1 Tax=Syncephalastrum racemosum TaxID=13706 RepID=A0A1X2HAS5_SYNRA|nr:hypothetical protein BCR43DRAFT_506186 [Syncephalastrum racemosum]